MQQMKTYKTYLYPVVLVILILQNDLYAQNNNSFNQSSSFIVASFRQEEIIIEPDASFFNVLIIENLGERREEVFVEISVPVDWSVIAAETRSFLLDPGDSLILPVRVAPSRNVLGEIAYSVIAAVNNRDGETFANAYCFVKIPRKSDIAFRPITRMAYFDQVTGETTIVFRIINRGNVNEMVFLNFTSTRNVALENERENILQKTLTVNSRSDTTIRLKAVQVDDPSVINGSLYRVDLRGSTEETTFSTSFWFTSLASDYKYRIPDSEKILIVDLALQNLMSQQPLLITGGVRGSLLFQQNRTLSYYFYRRGSGPVSELWKYNRSRITYTSPLLGITIGDIDGYNLKYGSGKGASIRYSFTDDFSATVMASENLFRPITNFGLVLQESYSNQNFRLSYSNSQNRFFDTQAHVIGTQFGLRFAQGHSARLQLNVSDVQFNLPENSYQGIGLLFDYQGRVNNTTIRLREQFTSNEFYGRNPGRHTFNAQVVHPLRNSYSLDFNVFDSRYRPLIETNMGIDSERFLENTSVNANLRAFIDRGLTVFGGPVFERKATNTFFLYNEDDPFVSYSSKLSLAARINDGRGLTFNPSVTMGYTFVTSFSEPDPDFLPAQFGQRDESFFNAMVSFNLRRTDWGLFLNYFYGPYSVNQEISKFYYGIQTHSIRLMPYYEAFIYRDIVRLASRLSYLYDFTFRTNRVNLNNQMDVFIGHDLTISLVNTLSYQVTVDQLTDESYRYSNNYVELRVTKGFNWNQPRVKYHDLEINLFKDLNGNLIREFNEPGIQDVLVTITSIDPVRYQDMGVDYEPPQMMVTQRLLTGMDGIVRYNNIPRGLYRIQLENIGANSSSFFPDQNEFIINVADDKTVYVPYLERNRIFGRVILNRSRLSTLGRIEVGNIRITATDSRDRQTSTLTDSDGYFEMYVPSVDNYTVTVTNIFRDHFNLRQNNFRANLNGFKQFEVNFVFDEIRRQIEFTPGATDIQAEIRRVGRTNLSGTVRDATTLQPVRAMVEVVDNTTGNTVQQAPADRTSGRYSTSFATGEDLMIAVSASGYWIHTERLFLDQFLTIQDVERDILLESITIGARFQLNNLRFAAGSIEIPTEALPELDRLISQLRQNPNVRIRIEGHSDAAETLNNPNISMQRAEAIMRYMVQNGYSNIEFTGLRDSRPVAPGDTEENRRRNRRVEIVVVDR